MAQKSDSSSNCSFFTDSVQNRIIYTEAELMPKFPGGKDSLNLFITNRLQETLEKISFSQTIYISFIIEADGSLTNNKIEKEGDPFLTWELNKLLSKSPKWNPGKCNGEDVAVKLLFPFYLKRK